MLQLLELVLRGQTLFLAEQIKKLAADFPRVIYSASVLLVKLSSVLDLLPELDQATITTGVSKLLLVKWDFSDINRYQRVLHYNVSY